MSRRYIRNEYSDKSPLDGNARGKRSRTDSEIDEELCNEDEGNSSIRHNLVLEDKEVKQYYFSPYMNSTSWKIETKMIEITHADIKIVVKHLLAGVDTPLRDLENKIKFQNGTHSRFKTRICFRLLKRSGFLSMSSGKYYLADRTAVPTEADLSLFEKSELEEIEGPKQKKGRSLIPSSSSSSSSSPSTSATAGSRRSDLPYSEEKYRKQSLSPLHADARLPLELGRKLLCAAYDAQMHTNKLESWAHFQLSCSSLSDVKKLHDLYQDVSQQLLPSSPKESAFAADAVNNGEVASFSKSTVKELKAILDDAHLQLLALQEQAQAAERKLAYLQFRSKELAKGQVRDWIEQYMQEMQEREKACKIDMSSIVEKEPIIMPHEIPRLLTQESANRAASSSWSSSRTGLTTKPAPSAGACAEAIEAPNSDSAAGRSGPVYQMQHPHAVFYLNAVRNRFDDDPDTYSAFLKILYAYQKQQMGVENVLEQVSLLLADHPDLLREFMHLLPDEVQDQAKERLYKAASESEMRRRSM